MAALKERLQARVFQAVDTVIPQPLFSRGIDGRPMLIDTPDPKRTSGHASRRTAAAVAIPLALASCSSNGEQIPPQATTTIYVDRPTTVTVNTSGTISPSAEVSPSATGIPSTNSSPVETTPAEPTSSESNLEKRISSFNSNVAAFIIERYHDPKVANTPDADETTATDGTQQTKFTLQINTGTAGHGQPYQVWNLSASVGGTKDDPDLTTIDEVTLSYEHGRVPYDTVPYADKSFSLRRVKDSQGIPINDAWKITVSAKDPGLTTRTDGQTIREAEERAYQKKLDAMIRSFESAQNATYRQP